MSTERNLLSRLPGVSFLVLAPAAQEVCPPLAAPVIDPATHGELLTQVARLRALAGVGAADGEGDGHDSECWHVLAVRGEDRSLVGAIRARIYDLRASHPRASALFEFSGVRIADDEASRLVERALTEYIDSQVSRSWGFHQVGGFAVAPGLRGTALGPILALSMNTLLGLLGLHGGCTFATFEHNVAALDRRVGAAGLSHADGELPPFYCERHQSLGQLLATETGRFDPRLANTAAALVERLQTAIAFTPG
ncbi:MAG: hypothetical protein KF751_11385 [Nitrospira sp.]|nr:hypothetical protein [Nitrospira sp.]